eukprot:3806664-Pyramimonas_sp.AAC.1
MKRILRTDLRGQARGNWQWQALRQSHTCNGNAIMQSTSPGCRIKFGGKSLEPTTWTRGP